MLTLVASLVACCAFAPLAIAVANRLGLRDVAGDRSLHTGVVPLAGGLACLAGLTAGLLAWRFSQSAADTPEGSLLPGLALVAALVAVIGLADDRWRLPALPRLFAQVAAGAAGAAVVGVQTPLAAGAGQLFGPPAAGGLLLLAAGLALLPVTVNVVNFMDGINGITGLQLGLWGVVAWGVGTADENAVVAALGALTAGCALGFLPWNLPAARAFFGDAGSYLLGALVGLTILAALGRGTSPLLLVVPLLLSLADTGTVLVRRAARGAPLTVGHREFVYQRLVHAAGMSHPAVAVLTTCWSALIVLSWLAADRRVSVLVTALLLIGYLAAVPVVQRIRHVTGDATGPASASTAASVGVRDLDTPAQRPPTGRAA